MITSSQDGCPLKDIKTTSAQGANGMTDVTVTFKMWTCVDEAAVKDSVNELHFDLIQEAGKPVIDDIHRVADGERDSVIEEMQSIAKGE
ncbi:efflux RND transporter permease subunit [Neorhizobium galegae]|nr:efflux RND transporter permease subunit [Neorhizobium galegae]